MTALRRLELSSQSGSILSGGLHSDNTQWASSLLSLQYLGMSLVNFSKATDLIQVLNTLPSLLHLGLSACGIQSIHFSHVALNSTLSKLQYLDLSSNRISGPVPDVLKNMTDLRELDLSSNKFNSTAPLWSVDSKSLVSLDIGYNQFDKIEAPLSSMLSNACSLKSLNLLENPFGSLMFGSKLNSSRCLSYSLESLNIQNTEATGNIPDWLGKFKSLKDLNLGQNLLSGPVPPSIIQLPLLGSLDLSINRLTGEIPGSLTRLPALKSLDLSNNLLTGEIPRSFGSHFPVLERLDLSYNRLNGTIPHALGGLSTLQYLYLAHNTLNGLIPWSLERLSNLKQLVLLNNKLSGPVFQSMGQIASLEALDISSNPLEGVISELHFANLTELKYLIISSTNLTWDVESNWVPPFSLHTLNMSSGGTRLIFPHWLRTQKDIHEIDFSKARIRGSFPRWFRAENLEYMDLSMNQISGESLAQIFEAAPKIQILLLGNNSMIGPISNSLCTLENLFILDVSGNKISGELPNCFTGLSRFLIINLSGNRLSGKIPNSLGNLQFLYRFHVNQNYLDGVIPLSLGNCTYLEVLDLGENRFSGSIPSWIGEKLSSLRILRLRKNMLNGTIPPQLCKLSNLQILDLAQNYLAGEIPHCIGNLTGMTTHTTTEVFTYTSIYAPRQGFFLDYFDGEWNRVRILESTKGLNHLEYTRMPLQLLNLLDLSSNKLVGVIPKEICLLNGLKSLTLSHNNLSGNIPEMVGNLKLLDTLDLSYNKLSGEIPRSMSALSSISQLNFSYNNLSGRIPTGNQLQTLIDPSIYSGNILLCGAPLRKSCPDDDDHSIQQKTDKDHEDETKEKIVFWCVVIAGYATGFLAVIGTLIFNRGRGGSNIFSLLRKFMR